MTIKPLSDRVLVLPNPAEEKTAGGLFIPDTAKEKPLMGKVVAVGPGTADVKFTPSWASVCPMAALVFTFLAQRAIKADERLVRAADRIR